MNVSTPQAPRKDEKPAFLFRGPPGGGKTTIALQFPDVWMADIDLNTRGPELYLRQKRKLDLTYAYDYIPFDDNGNVIPADKQWDRLKLKVTEVVRNPEIKTVFVDGLSGADNILIRWVMGKANIADHATMEQQHWIPFRNQMLWLLTTCRTMNKILIISCHEQIRSDRLGNIEGYDVAMHSRLSNYLAGFFTDCWRFDTSPQPGNKQKFFVQTTKTTRADLKNSFGMQGEIDLTNDGFGALNKYMKL